MEDQKQELPSFEMWLSGSKERRLLDSFAEGKAEETFPRSWSLPFQFSPFTFSSAKSAMKFQMETALLPANPLQTLLAEKHITSFVWLEYHLRNFSLLNDINHSFNQLAHIYFVIFKLFFPLMLSKHENVKDFVYLLMYIQHLGFPGGSVGKESTCNERDAGRHRFNPWVRKIP